MFNLINLPYNKDAIGSYMSAETLEFHHGKHLQAYVNFVNDFVAKESSFANKSLEEIIIESSKNPQWQGLFNNAGQVYNHNEFFSVLKASDSPSVSQKMFNAVNKDFGSFDNFKVQFIDAGKTQFGSGWVWLVVNNGKLEIKKYANAGNPVADNLKGILVCDVWEHAYYIDYRNRRPDFLTAFIEHMVNWEYVEKKFNEAK